MPRKPKPERPRKYGDYVTEIDKKLYTIVRLPLGNKKYKTKTVLLEKIGGAKTEARKWAWEELDKHKKGTFNKSEAIRWTFDQAVRWYKKEFLIPVVKERGIKVEGGDLSGNRMYLIVIYSIKKEFEKPFEYDEFTQKPNHCS